MFTGIVETCGEVAALKSVATGAELWVKAPFTAEVALGESVANNGACLTVTEVRDGAMRSTYSTRPCASPISAASPRRSRQSRALPPHRRPPQRPLRAGSCRCLRRSDRLRAGRERPPFLRGTSPRIRPSRRAKGSICVNGISLTVAELHDDRFVLWIIPHTHEVTNLHSVTTGARVNLEFDLLAKHLARLREFDR